MNIFAKKKPKIILLTIVLLAVFSGVASATYIEDVSSNRMPWFQYEEGRFTIDPATRDQAKLEMEKIKNGSSSNINYDPEKIQSARQEALVKKAEIMSQQESLS